MSEQSYYEKLGVNEDASFDEIQQARQRLIQQYHGDQERLDVIEAAYDAILMERLKMRQEGKIKVPEKIRFPEKQPAGTPNYPPVNVKNSSAWLQKLIDQPKLGDILWPSGLFLALSGLVISSGASSSNLPTALAFGVGLTLFFLNRKERKFGRAVLLTLIGLLLGVGIGALLQTSLLIGTNIPLSADKVTTLVTFLILWLISSFLR